MYKVPYLGAYTYHASAKTLDLSGMPGTFNEKQLSGVFNLTTGDILFIPAQETYKLANVTGSVITFSAPNTGMQDTDELLILYFDPTLQQPVLDAATLTVLTAILAKFGMAGATWNGASTTGLTPTLSDGGRTVTWPLTTSIITPAILSASAYASGEYFLAARVRLTGAFNIQAVVGFANSGFDVNNIASISGHALAVSAGTFGTTNSAIAADSALLNTHTLADGDILIDYIDRSGNAWHGLVPFNVEYDDLQNMIGFGSLPLGMPSGALSPMVAIIGGTTAGTGTISLTAMTDDEVAIAGITPKTGFVNVTTAGALAVSAQQSGSWATGRTWNLEYPSDQVGVQGSVSIDGPVIIGGNPTVSVTNFPSNYPDSQAHTDLQAIEATLTDIDAKTPALVGGAVPVGVVNTVPVSGTFWQTTQPVSQAVANWTMNITQFGGSAVVTGVGNSGAGIPRMTVSSDSIPGRSWALTNTGGTPDKTIVSGETAIGSPPANPPVGVSGVDGSGNKRALLTDTTGAQVLSASAANAGAIKITDGTNANTIKTLGTQVVSTDYGIVTNSVIHGLTTGGGGGYVDVKVNPSGALTVESTQPSGTNYAINVTQFGGAPVVTGTGSGGVGIPRVTVSNDSVIGPKVSAPASWTGTSFDARNYASVTIYCTVAPTSNTPSIQISPDNVAQEVQTAVTNSAGGISTASTITAIGTYSVAGGAYVSLSTLSGANGGTFFISAGQ